MIKIQAHLCGPTPNSAQHTRFSSLLQLVDCLRARAKKFKIDLKWINNILLSSESGFLVSDSENMAGLAASASFEAYFKNMKIVCIDDSDLFEKSVQPMALKECIDSEQHGRRWNDPADHGITDER